MSVLLTGQASGFGALPLAIEREMSGRHGAVVVLDARTGRLVACHDRERAALRQARPGSSVKPFTLLALLESGEVTERTRLVCGRNLRLGGRRLDCTHPDDQAPLDAPTALAFSCNWFFIQAVRRLSPDGLLRSFQRAGLSARTGLVEPEASGVIRRAGSVEQLQLQAVGESSIEVTPLGLAGAYRWLAGEFGRSTVLREGLTGCVRYGTGQLAERGPLAVAGKTGTATSKSGAFTHGWFAGFTEEIVVVVFLEHGQGALDAAPIAGAVFEAYKRAG